MAGDDTTPDPLFKNVTRRQRSAASWPRKEEPDGGDPGSGSGVSSNASPPATTPVASNNKRQKPSSNAAGGAEHVPRAKKHRLAPIEEPVPEQEYAEDRGVVGALDRRHGTLDGMMPPALSHKDKAAAAAAAASSASSSSEAEPAAVDWAETERCRKGKGKTPVVNDEDDDAFAAVARRRPPAGSGLGNKLLGDAIRSHGRTAAAAAAVAGSFEPSSKTTKPPKKHRRKPNEEKPTKKDNRDWFWCGMGTGRDSMSSAGSDVDYSFDAIGVVSDRLRTTLRGLGVAAPVRLYGKLLTGSDRITQHARLLMSCKRWLADGAEFPLYEFLTEEERREAHGKGLPLTAYDRGGDAYELKLRFLKSNAAGRLIKKWGDFLRHNDLVVGKHEPAPVHDVVMLDLWLFRPPGGKVRMVVLHYRRGDAAHADAALDEVEQKRLQLMLNNGDAAGAGGNGNDDDDDGDGDADIEDVVGDANEEGDEDAGVKGGEVAAAAPAPSSPSEPCGGAAAAPGEVAATSSSPSEPDDGVGAKAAAEEQAGALGEVADAPSSTSPELHGGAGRSDEVTAPLSSLGGDGTAEKEQEAGGALMVMVLEVEAVTQSSLDSNAGGEANEVAAPPSSPQAGGGGAAMMATEDPAAAELEAAARSSNVTKHEYQAALGLVMLSKKANS